jgi:ATP-dependent DNA helicase RecG
MYDDRLTITSPGGMYKGRAIQEQDIEQIESERRNPILADLFQRMRYMERRGSGLQKIVNETKNLPGYSDGLKPEFFSDTSFRVVIKNVNYRPNEADSEVVNGVVSGAASGVVSGVVNGAVSEIESRREKVLIALKANSRLTKTQLAEILGIPKTTLDRDLTALKNDYKITRVGSDKSGHWEILS